MNELEDKFIEYIKKHGSKALSHNVYCVSELSDREKQIFQHFVNKKWKGKIGSVANNAVAMIKTKHIYLTEDINYLIHELKKKIKKLENIKNELNEVSTWL